MQIISQLGSPRKSVPPILIHWPLRRDEICDSGLCPDAPRGRACDPLPTGPARMCADPGIRLRTRRGPDLRAALNRGFHISLDDVKGSAADVAGAI
jgi:hypothetical protein